MIGAISRIFGQNLFYDGKSTKLSTYVDSDYATKRYLEMEHLCEISKDFELNKINLQYQDRELNVVIPVYTPPKDSPLTEIDIQNAISQTNDMLVIVSRYVADKVIDDIIYGEIQQLFKHYKVFSSSGSVSTKTSYPFFIKHNTDQTLHNKDLPTILAMKEYVQGFCIKDPFYIPTGDPINPFKAESFGNELIFDNPFLKANIKYPFHLEPGMFNLNETKNLLIPQHYTTQLRNILFSKQAELNQKIGLIKEVKLMQDRQYDSEIVEGIISLYVGPRRLGKTFKVIYNCLKKIHRKNFLSVFEPTTILYFSHKEEVLIPPINYLKGMIAQTPEAFKHMYTWKESTKTFTFQAYTSVESTEPTVIGQIKFMTAGGDNAGIGFGANYIVLDEMAKLNKKFIEGIMPIVTHQKARLIGLSTNYYDEPFGLFHEMVQEAEGAQAQYGDLYERVGTQYRETMLNGKSIDNDIPLLRQLKTGDIPMVAKRYTIDDAEYLSDHEKQNLKLLYSNNPLRYNCELYSRFAAENKVFNYGGRVHSHHKLLPILHDPTTPKYKYICMSYDPALTKDMASVSLLGFNEATKQFVFLEERYINKTKNSSKVLKDNASYSDQATTYFEQFQIIKQYMVQWSKTYLHKECVVYGVNNSSSVILPAGFMFVMDGTDLGLSEYLLQNGITPTYIFQRGPSSTLNVNKGQYDNSFVINKNKMVDTAKELMDNGFVIFSDMCKLIQREMDTYIKKITASGNITYQAAHQSESPTQDGQRNFDDLVSTYIMSVFAMAETWKVMGDIHSHGMGIKYDLFKNQEISDNSKKEMEDNWNTLNMLSRYGEIQSSHGDFMKKFIY